MKSSKLKKTALIFFGLVLSVFAIEITLQILGLIIISLPELRNRSHNKDSYRIMCIGESTTQGQYPQFLENILNARSKRIKFSVIDRGLGGTNTTHILSRLKKDLVEYQPDMVVAMMGINDGPGNLPYTDKGFFSKYIKSYKLWAILMEHINYNINSIIDHNSFKSNLSNKITDQDMRTAINCYYNEDFNTTKPILEKLIEKYGSNSYLYLILADIYKRTGDSVNAEKMLIKSLDKDPANVHKYYEISRFYLDSGNYTKALKYSNDAISKGDNNPWTYNQIAHIYLYLKRYNESIAFMKKAIQLNPKNDLFYSALGTIYLSSGNKKLAQYYLDRGERIRLNYYNPVLYNNYRIFVREVISRNIKLVCMQYPNRSIEPLKNMLEPNNSIIFVENKDNFIFALSNFNTFEDLFRDNWAGDFGHCTDKGNKIIAENLAKTIIDALGL